jgi:hypothetical protein
MISLSAGQMEIRTLATRNCSVPRQEKEATRSETAFTWSSPNQPFKKGHLRRGWDLSNSARPALHSFPRLDIPSDNP